jgi:type IV pilus assembly protein PilF
MNRMIIRISFLAVFMCAGCAAMEASEKKASYHYQMGISLLAERNYTKALVELTEAEKIDPHDPALLNCLGQAYFFKQKYEIAEKKYLHAIELKPGFSEARNNLGVNYLEMQRWDDAIAQLQRVVDDIFYQNHDDATVNLALAYYGKGDNAAALSLMRPVLARNPRNPAVRLNMGRIYLADDKAALAVAEFRKAVELNRNFTKARYHLAMALLKTRDIDAAKEEFREILRLDPDGELGQLSREHLDTLK